MPCQRVRGSWFQPSWGTGTQASSPGAAGEQFLAESIASAGLEGKPRGRLEGPQGSSCLEHRCLAVGVSSSPGQGGVYGMGFDRRQTWFTKQGDGETWRSFDQG